MASPLQQLTDHGQSPWLDYVAREFTRSGKLEDLVERGIVGVTSNPTIFQKAIAEGDAYDEQLREVAREHEDPKEVFLALAIEDIREACDVLRPVFDRGEETRDGWVSLEVDPNVAHDAERTREEAKRLHAAVGKPNLFIKIPGTEEGLEAIEETIAAGIPVNVTLLFSLERHRQAAEAYVRGLERLQADGGDLSHRRLGGVVLRLPRRQRGRQAARRPRRPRRAEGQAGDRQRQARLPDLPRGLLGRAVGGAQGRRREPAALPVGLDLDQEPRLPRRDLRRGADRRRDGEHDAAGDDRGLRGPRPARRHARGRASTRPGRRSSASPRRGSTTTTWWRPWSARACRSSPTASRSCSRASRPSATSSSPPEPLSPGTFAPARPATRWPCCRSGLASRRAATASRRSRPSARSAAPSA